MRIPLPQHDGSNPSFLVVDLFCGAGGVTTGFAMSGKAKVIACVNHDHTAILSHWANHPEVNHFEEDMRVLNLEALVLICNHYRALYPRAKLILHGSLECTNYSKAKGGLAKDADSRTLADELHRYIRAINPDMVTIENVVEFMDWGPLQIKPKRNYITDEGWQATELTMMKNKHKETVYGWIPIPELKGTDFKRWCNEMCEHGYKMDWVEMNAANYGAYTSRNRLYGCFAVPEIPIVWPTKTHNKLGNKGLQKWNAVKEKIDFKDEGYSIFYRSTNMNIPKAFRQDICENTLERLLKGCIKHIAGGNKAFLSKYHGGKPDTRNNSLDNPLGVIDTENRYAIIQAQEFELFADPFLAAYHSRGHNTHSINSAGPTLPCNDSVAIINPAFIHRAFSNGGESSSIETVAGSILEKPKLDLVQGVMFIDSTNYGNTPTSVEEPLGTITADGHWPYLFNPVYGGQTHAVSDPAPVIIARQDKSPLSIVFTEQGEPAFPLLPTDTPMVKELKKFMAMYGLRDIKMRMLKVTELLGIQGFPVGYVLGGTQTEQKKHIGNSVEPNQISCWAIAMDDAIFKIAA